MLSNSSETPIIALILLFAVGILVWGYNRGKAYGRLGILAWLQSVVLMAPWLIFFGLLATGVYVNLVGILFLLIVSIGLYIYLGKLLRAEGQEIHLPPKTTQLLNEKLESDSSADTATTHSPDPDIIPEFVPIPEADLQQIQNIFNIDTFFATETIAYQEGAIFKGNLRNDPEIAYQRLSEKLKAQFEDQYRLFLVEGTEGKPVVIILPSNDDPQQTTLAQKNLAVVLAVATMATSLEAASLLLGFDLFSDWGRYYETIPLALGLWAVLGVHEIGHWVWAKRYNLRLSVPFFLPTWQIGSFGAITRFESLIPHRSALFDVAFAGPVCGGILSLLFLVVGLVLSHSGSFFQIPSQFFQASILVGSLAKVILGEQLQQPLVAIHPLTVVGWLGLVITALNLLPAGQLDGGRVIQAIYGRKIARRTTIATLIILGIVSFINPANPIPLYWAIVILFLQRNLERPSLNELTEPDDARAAWGLLALFLMLATLIPLSPGLAGQLGIGG